MNKKIISIALAVCMILALLPGESLAEEWPISGSCGKDGDNVTWEYDTDLAILTIRGVGEMKDYIPAAEISPLMFYCKGMKAVVIEDGVTSIGNMSLGFAFGDEAPDPEAATFTSVTIPNSVTRIGSDSFSYNYSLSDISIPDSVTSIGQNAFLGCTSLERVEVPDKVTTINEGTFASCYSLTDVYLSDSIVAIKTGAFDNCGNLKDIYYGGTKEQWKEVVIEPYNEELTSATIHYSNNDGTENVLIMEESLENPAGNCGINGDNVTWLFDKGTGTLTIRGKGEMENYDQEQYSVGDGGIETPWTKGDMWDVLGPNGEFIETVIIEPGVTKIGNFAFSYLNMYVLVIPDTVTSIGYGAIYSSRLTDIYYSGTENQWNNIDIIDDGPALVTNFGNSNPIFHYDSSSPEYLYDGCDPAEYMELPAAQIDAVTDIPSAVGAVVNLTETMSDKQKHSPANIDLATLYAETAAAKASSQEVSGSDILINAEVLSKLEPTAIAASEAVDTALTDGGITTARYLSKTVILTTDETSVNIRIDPDVLNTEVDKVRVETPAYAITFKLSDLAPDLMQALTFTAEAINPSARIAANGVNIAMPDGGTTNSVTVSVPSNSGDTTHQTVASADGTAITSKYNPATTKMDGKINQSGTYAAITNEKDFTDIGSKSREMQEAIRYLASKGIINGRTATTFEPDDSITRAEIATLLVDALGKKDTHATPTFSDVTSNDWFYSEVASSQKHGLINGFEDNTFRGTTAINKVQIVAVASRVLTSEMKYRTPADPATYLSKYSDSVSKWAQPEVALATRENLVVYRIDGTFSGDKNMTRGDAAIIIYRLFQRIW